MAHQIRHLLRNHRNPCKAAHAERIRDMQSRREMAMHIPYSVFPSPSAAFELYECGDENPDDQSEYHAQEHSYLCL